MLSAKLLGAKQRVSGLVESLRTRHAAATQTDARPPRQWPRRLGVATLKLGTTLALAWGLLVCGREVYEYATTSPRFEVQHFIYAPTDHVDDEHMRELLAIAPGTNILACDLTELSERIAAHPWVAQATLTRNMPDTLEISVVEHEAVAIVLAERFYLINAEGRPFKQVERGERGELPIITGIERERLLAEAEAEAEVDTGGGSASTKHDSPAPLAEIVDALALIEVYAGKQRPRLGELNLGDDGSVTLYTASSGTALRLGREGFEQRLERWDALRVALGDRAERLAVVHLDHESRPDRRDRVVARFASERDEVVLLAAAATEHAGGEPAASERGLEAAPLAKDRMPARAAGRRNRIPSYE